MQHVFPPGVADGIPTDVEGGSGLEGEAHAVIGADPDELRLLRHLAFHQRLYCRGHLPARR